MRRVPIIVRRELGAFFHSMIAYVILAVFLVINGAYFRSTLIEPGEASLERVFYLMEFLFIFLAPLLTMRLLAEERRSNTLEMLMTAPVTDTEVVIGKFLGVFIFYLVMLAPTLLYWAVVEHLCPPGAEMDRGPVLTGYLGMVLLGAYLLSFGLLASALTSSQVVAGFVGVIGLLVMLFIYGWVPDPKSILFAQTRADRILKGLYGLLRYMSYFERVDGFLKGVIDARDVVFFVTMTGLFLFLTVQVVSARKWR